MLRYEGQSYVTRCVKLLSHQEPIEGIRVWILLGYPSNVLQYPGYVRTSIPSNVLGYPSKCW